ncbi:helix-turn-helix transcriptional regulator [Kitasatospora sp. SUK 42]|uniref:helix-turn-helix transcriptional regulator n=1 Tax=Kitasatospora sp. SUK 42 TaxID=1588882 RepID=UPI0018CBB4CA|nr:helix-turn-helix transcriptional regulator [Kitasatospora sp. SUK 42]MBV2152039.1 PadR family transcriptional regulator [Kitasatospora sp. SUK 42]
MSPVFGHGRLRLYLLKLLDEAPRHGYEVIRLLEERFQGLYAPSAGTVYPRLAKLEQEGLVSHSTEGGRKVYRLTDAGRVELQARQAELDELELEIHESVAQLAGAIREDVRDSAKDLREELWQAAKQAPRPDRTEGGGGDPWAGPWGDNESWQRAKDEFAEFKRQAKEQAKRAREQEKAAKAKAKAAEEEARRLREQAKASRTAAQQEALRIKRRVEQQVREHAAKGDWPTGLAEGLSELTRGLAGLADAARWGHPAEAPEEAPPAAPQERVTVTRIDLDKDDDQDNGGAGGRAGATAPADLPPWTHTDPAGEPTRELERLLDRFRDQVRDAARDGGVSADKLAEARSVLGSAGERLKRLLG